MGLFGKKKVATPIVEYNPENQRAVLKCSICNGEQVAGFKDKQTGHFTEVMLIRNGQDMDRFFRAILEWSLVINKVIYLYK